MRQETQEMGVITVTNKNDKKRTSKKSSFVKRDKTLSNDRSFSIVDSKSPFTITEAYKSLRTNIIFSTGDNGCKKYGNEKWDCIEMSLEL